MTGNTLMRSMRTFAMVLFAALAVAGLQSRASAQDRVRLTVPETVTVGTRFPVAWDGSLATGDFVTVVPADAPPDTVGPYIRTGRGTEGQLVAPGVPGLYEVRYVTQNERKPAGIAVIEVLDTRVDVTAPATAEAGGRIVVKWGKPIAPEDYVTIVPADAPDDAAGLRLLVRASESGTLTVPPEPGRYEVRYVLASAGRTLGAAPLEVVEAKVALSAPPQAVVGQPLLVTWDRPIAPDDAVTLVPADAPADAIDRHVRVRADRVATLTAPSTPGSYEVRYVLGSAGRAIARVPVEVVEAAVQLTVPAEVPTGEGFPISWSRIVDSGDIVTIVEASAPPDTVGAYFNVRRTTQGRFDAPREPGLYEVRYLRADGHRVLARAPIEVVRPAVTLSSPSAVEPGARLEVRWDRTVNPNDIVTIVPATAPPNAIDVYVRTQGNSTATMRAPAAPGSYEIRYIRFSTGRIAGSRPLDVESPAVAAAATTTPDVPISLQAPETVGAGESFTVEWSGPGASRDRLTIARPDDPATRWARSARLGQESTVELTAPGEPGAYEVRYLDLDRREVLARVPLEVGE